MCLCLETWGDRNVTVGLMVTELTLAQYMSNQRARLAPESLP